MNTHRMLRNVQDVVQQSLDMLFPPRCAGCKKAGTILCTACLTAIVPMKLPLCVHCGTSLAPSGMCQQCQYHRVKLSGLRAVSSYQEPLRTCIHALKYDGNVRLAMPLGFLLAQAYRYYALRVDAMMAVPLHSERQQARGYNHAYLLAEVCAKQVQVPLYDNIVVRHRATPAQVGLSASERHQNVMGAFCCTSQFANGALHGRSILLIDDVYTTGATLEACATPLFAAGAKAVWGLVLARPV
ncbi:MAG: ComF family protein [Ktedonobacteraceae bacterium]